MGATEQCDPVFPDGSVRDPMGRVLQSAAGEEDAEASVPYPPEAWERKKRSERLLEHRDLRVPSHLPPIVSEPELRLRTPQDVAGRALALFLVAIRAESLATGEPLSGVELKARVPAGFDYLSPAERSFLDAEAPSEHEIGQLSWRYECLYLLEWALGLIEALPFPGEICDVPLAARIILDCPGTELLAEARLRDATEILDAVDLHYRMHWLLRQAQIDQTEPPNELDGGVVSERHYALNWLVRFEESDWDVVDTPT